MFLRTTHRGLSKQACAALFCAYSVTMGVTRAIRETYRFLVYGYTTTLELHKYGQKSFKQAYKDQEEIVFAKVFVKIFLAIRRCSRIGFSYWIDKIKHQ